MFISDFRIKKTGVKKYLNRCLYKREYFYDNLYNVESEIKIGIEALCAKEIGIRPQKQTYE